MRRVKAPLVKWLLIGTAAVLALANVAAALADNISWP